jgi:uncharacterized phage infection (PIP) family protein YhgE
MADPLSLAASSIAVIQISGKVAQLCYNYIRSVRNAPKDLERLAVEITTVEEILKTLNERLQAKDKDGNPQFATLNQRANQYSLKKYITALKKLQKKLDSSHQIKRFIKKIFWPLREEEMRELLGLIDREKSHLGLLLQLESM